MADNLIARQQSGWLLIGSLPDVCKTRISGKKVPVPYLVIAELDESIQTAEKVRANGHPMVVYDGSIVPRTIGDEPGTKKGVKSGTVAGNCYPTDWSKSVRVQGKFIVRHGDTFFMNGL